MVLTYDSCYKLLFSTPELVRELITAFTENDWLRSLDFETLEKNTPAIRWRQPAPTRQ
ncbi:hypothetical protein [Cupriavidus gilardii]|uniref:hypothetical protein n=1 Tax=Cupriavidus gilardii TaxID=82541 RepID=UPI001EE4F0D1|nr:hypothetical protein [Cupriavidus gilardii]MCG5260187.1 hypothetical protein [Cupriavidus gilardii]